MWSEDLAKDIVEIFVEAQWLGRPRRARVAAALRPSLGRWPPPKLAPGGEHVCDACGYSAFTFQQLNSHKYGHRRELKVAV